MWNSAAITRAEEKSLFVKLVCSNSIMAQPNSSDVYSYVWPYIEGMFVIIMDYGGFKTSLSS